MVPQPLINEHSHIKNDIQAHQPTLLIYKQEVSLISSDVPTHTLQYTKETELIFFHTYVPMLRRISILFMKWNHLI